MNPSSSTTGEIKEGWLHSPNSHHQSREQIALCPFVSSFPFSLPLLLCHPLETSGQRWQRAGGAQIRKCHTLTTPRPDSIPVASRRVLLFKDFPSLWSLKLGVTLCNAIKLRARDSCGSATKCYPAVSWQEPRCQPWWFSLSPPAPPLADLSPCGTDERTNTLSCVILCSAASGVIMGWSGNAAHGGVS